MMCKSPEDRYATPLQVAQALEPYEDEYSIATNGHSEQHATPETGVVSPTAAVVDAALPKEGAESRTAGVAVADSARLKTLPDPAVNHHAESGVRVPSTVLTPDSGQGSDPEFPINLILAPEPSLAEGLSRPKTRSGASHSDSSSEPNLLLRLPRNWLWGLLAITSIVLVSVGVLAVINPFADTMATVNKPGVSLVGDKAESPSKLTDVKGKSTTHQPDAAGLSSPIVVRSDAGVEQEFSADKLSDAMKTALGGRGWVELRNREPLKLISAGNAPLDFRTARGTLGIRAAAGIEPVIDVTLNGSKPLLVLGSAVTLKISGVTFVVHYPGPGAPASPAPPAVITTMGSAKFDRCAFKVAPGPHPKGCRVLQSNIAVLEVDRCWFEGFDSAIEVAAESRTNVQIRQTMIVRAAVRESTETSRSEGYGWGVKLRFAGAVRPQAKAVPPPNFALDHCTLEGAGLFDLTDSPGPAPVKVEVKRCVLRSNTLLAVNPKRGPLGQVQWDGESNYYDVLGRSWIVNSASEGSPLFSASATDLDGWVDFVRQEKNPIRIKLKYRIDPSARGELLQPRDFTIEESAQTQSHPGADPKLVGPWSPP
jgi:eukaryotic-like serine/threonine-protein kinase